MTFSIDLARFGLLLIVVGTLINGFFASLCYEYAPDATGKTGLVHGTFLGDPKDIHADLVELALCYPPFTKIDVSSWPPIYQKYALQNHYHSFDLSGSQPVDVSSWSTSFDSQDHDDSFDLPHPVQWLSRSTSSALR